MEIGPDIELDDGLVTALVGCGRDGHRIAQAHNNDPGSNGFTFGTDRYQRSTEFAAEILRGQGFSVSRRGAGLIARHDGLELQFAVARGVDLSDPSNFDAGSSPARRKAGASNATQLAFDGMPNRAAEPIVHIVWSGATEVGQTAVHAGRLITGAGERLDWEFLVRLDEPTASAQQDMLEPAGMPTYAEQPEPTLDVATRSDMTRSDEG